MEVEEIDERKKLYLKELGKEEKLLRRAFVAGYFYGISLMWIFHKRETRGTDNEKDAFNFGRDIAALFAIVVFVSLLWILIRIFVGGG